jgi:hypothetical protein
MSKYSTGDINGYQEMKMPDGSWKYVGKKGINHPAVQHLFQNGTISIIPAHLRTSSALINQVILKCQPLMDRSVEFNKDLMQKKAKKNGVPFHWTQSYTNYIETSVTYKLVGALARYIKDSDKLESLDLHSSMAGIEGTIFLNREGKTYSINTRAIYAEGTIQRLHIRYLLKTDLPCLGVEEAKKMAERLSDVQKAQDKLKWAEIGLKKSEEGVIKYSEIVKNRQERIANKDYKKLVEESVREQYPYSPQNFTGKNLPGWVHENEDTYSAFIKESTKTEIERDKGTLKQYKSTLAHQKTLVKEYKEDISKLTKFLSE